MAEVLAILTVTLALPLNWFVAWRLWRLSLVTPRIRVLRERAIVATVLAIFVTVLGLVFLNNDLDVPYLDSATTRLVIRGTVLALSVASALYWLWIYRGTPPVKR